MATKRRKIYRKSGQLICAFLWLSSAGSAQTFETPELRLRLVKESQTVAALEPKSTPGFDFTPSDRLAQRSANRYHHLGDLILSLRVGTSGPWLKYDTAESRAPVKSLVEEPAFVTADLSPTLPAEIPLQIMRTWAVEKGQLVLRFDLKNKTNQPIQLGALGMPMIFNNILTGRSLKEAHEKCSFSDPYIGQDAGYLQVTRLSGAGPALVVVPDWTPFEAYQPLSEPTRPSQTFEGAFAWMVHTQAYVEDEWRGVVPWNPPTFAMIAPGETRTYSVKFLLSNEIRNIETTLAQNERPVAIGIPGYVLPMDIDGRLFIKHQRKITKFDVYPAGALELQEIGVAAGKWKVFSVRGKTWGRARLTLHYDDGLTQTISYYVIKPSAQAVADLGKFLFTRQWFDDPNDPFHRSPSVMSYDRETNKIVTQDSRVWIAGLGDEGGSGSWLAAAMKEFGQPRREEITKYEQFIDRVLWGGLQYNEGPNKYGVRKSLFYYSPQDAPDFNYDPSLNWSTWTSWKRADAESIGRGYNYPHVIAAYWSMYRLARNHRGLVTNHSWQWYLDHAYETASFMFGRQEDGRRRVGYVELGLMEGDIVVALLEDLKREAWNEKARVIETLMKERADRWQQEPYPFGSEMAWDSTGQEEVYAWCKYFGYDEKALVSLNSIIGYTPTLPHWGYNGNARRYWDFLYGGKIRRIERQLHHYGSGLNAIPVLAHYREHPDDEYLLRVGYGGMMGALANIDQEGFASVAFHSFPSTLKWDPYSGDYGPNFFGHAFNTATYVIKHREFGWQSFGGNISVSGDWVNVQPLDSFRKRVYIAPLGLWMTLDAGTFERVAINTKSNIVRTTLSRADRFTPNARLRIGSVGAYAPRGNFVNERDAFTIPLRRSTTTIELSHR